MRVIHVLRKPLSEGTVAANVVKHGCGGINIDASRVAAPGETISNHSRGDESAISKGIYGDSAGQETHQTEGQKSGRWPANVILQHLDGCRCEGIKRVKAIRTGVRDKSGEAHSKYRFQGEGTVRTDIHVGFADEDGKESVANWICVEGCPVAALDEQSGVRAKGNFPSQQNTTTGIRSSKGKSLTPEIDYGDSGGASRFFKQIGGEK